MARQTQTEARRIKRLCETHKYQGYLEGKNYMVVYFEQLSLWRRLVCAVRGTL
jgi:hypothetical protein